MTDIRSDYDFLDAPTRRRRGDAARVSIDGGFVDLNAVPDAFRKREPADARTLTKAEFVKRVAQQSGLSQKDAALAVNAVIASIEVALKSGEDVNFTGFGKFYVAKRGAREGRNPRTGEAMTIAASRVPRFTAGKVLRASASGMTADLTDVTGRRRQKRRARS